MAVANVLLMAVSLNIMDTPVGYRPPVGPSVYFTATYNQREANQPANFSYSNLGAKWTFNWLTYLQDDPGNPLATVQYYVSGGGTLTFSGFDTNSQTFTEWNLPPGAQPHGLLVDRRGQVWYTGNGNGTIGHLDPATGKVVEHKTPSGGDPHTLVIDDQGVPSWVGKRVRSDQTAGFDLHGYKDAGEGLTPP